MTFDDSATNLIVLLTAGLGLLGVDLFFWTKGRKTFSETIWTINQKSLALAFLVGAIAGHLFTVPR